MVDPPTPPVPDPGVALALGSAFLGVYAHGGFLCGLNQAGIFPGHIAGASAGALAAGFYAAGMRGAVLEKAVLSGTLKRSFPDVGMVLRGAPMFFIGRLTGLMNGKRVIKHLKRELPMDRIEGNPNVKLSIAVTDLRNLRSVFLTRGPLAESMMASCSVPILFTAQTLDGTKYHDGGILHELPVEPFIDNPAIHTIIVHRLALPNDKCRKNLGVSAAFSDSHQMLNNALFEFRRKDCERNGKRVIVIDTEHPNPGLFQTKAAKKRYFDEGFRSGLAIKQQPSS